MFGKTLGRRIASYTAAVAVALAMTIGTVPSNAAPAGSDTNATLKVGVFGDIISMDPTNASFLGTSNYLVANAIYDPLFVAENGVFKPFLAKSIKASKDLKTWTMKLPTGVKFSDGTAFNAAAVKFNFDRALDPATKCGCAGLVGNIASVAARNATTVVFTLKVGTSGFPTVLAKQVSYIGSPKAIKKFGADYGKNPVGTGPYVLKSLTPGVGAKLARNPLYRTAGAAAMAGIDVKVILDNATRYSALRSGDVDLILTDSVTNIASARKDGFQSKVASFEGSVTGIFNFKKPAMADLNVRRAIARAIDTAGITKVVTKGIVKPSNGPFGQSSNWVTGIFKTPYSPTDAKRLLTAYGKPVSLTYLTGVSEVQKQRATLIQQALKAVGIAMTIDQQAGASFVSKLVGGDFDIVELGSPDFVDPDVQLKLRFSSTSGQNFGKYNSSVVDDLLREAGETGKLSTRRAKYTQLAAVIMADLPYVWIHQNYFGVLHSSKVRNLPPFNEADLGAFRIGAVNKTR